MDANLTLRNGLVVAPGGLLRGGLSIRDGRVTHVGADATLPQAEQDIDVKGRVIFPGLIDPHVHLGIGPGAGRDRAGFRHHRQAGTRSAAGPERSGREQWRRAFRCRFERERRGRLGL